MNTLEMEAYLCAALPMVVDIQESRWFLYNVNSLHLRVYGVYFGHAGQRGPGLVPAARLPKLQ